MNGSSLHRPRRGRKAAVIAWTLIETTNLNTVDPVASLADTIARIPSQKITKGDGLPPSRCKGKRSGRTVTEIPVYRSFLAPGWGTRHFVICGVCGDLLDQLSDQRGGFGEQGTAQDVEKPRLVLNREGGKCHRPRDPQRRKGLRCLTDELQPAIS